MPCTHHCFPHHTSWSWLWVWFLQAGQIHAQHPDVQGRIRVWVPWHMRTISDERSWHLRVKRVRNAADGEIHVQH